MKDKENFLDFCATPSKLSPNQMPWEISLGKSINKCRRLNLSTTRTKKFDGSIYHLSKHAERYYFATSLTRSVWKFFNGEIHHSDGDKYNADSSNLILLSHEEHLKRRGVKTFRESKLKNFVCE